MLSTSEGNILEDERAIEVRKTTLSICPGITLDVVAPVVVVVLVVVVRKTNLCTREGNII